MPQVIGIELFDDEAPVNVANFLRHMNRLAPTDLVTENLAGQTLLLQYKAGASGVAKVSVKESMAGEADVLEDFFVTLKPNLIATTTNNPFPSLLVPSVKANVSVEIANNGAAPTSGNFDVVFLLVTIADASGKPVAPPA